MELAYYHTHTSALFNESWSLVGYIEYSLNTQSQRNAPSANIIGWSCTTTTLVYCYTCPLDARERIDQVSAEGVVALRVCTEKPSKHQLNINLVALFQLKEHRLCCAVLRVLTVVFPGGGYHLAVFHQLHLVIDALSFCSQIRVNRVGEGVKASTWGRERSCAHVNITSCKYP